MNLNAILLRHFPGPTNAGIREKIRKTVRAKEPQSLTPSERVDLLRYSVAFREMGRNALRGVVAELDVLERGGA